MLRIQPKSIVCERDDLILLNCFNGKELKSFPFTVKCKDVKGYEFRSIEHDNEFYAFTNDDPAVSSLEESIREFDESRHLSISSKTSDSVPEKIEVIDPLAGRYNVSLRNHGRVITFDVNVMLQGAMRTARWEFGSAQMTMNEKGFWKPMNENEKLLNAVLMLHQAIVPVYKV